MTECTHDRIATSRPPRISPRQHWFDACCLECGHRFQVRKKRESEVGINVWDTESGYDDNVAVRVKGDST